MGQRNPKENKRSWQSAHDGKMTKILMSCLNDDIVFPFSLKKLSGLSRIFGGGLWTEVHLPPRWTFLNEASVLSTDTYPCLLAFKQRTAEPEFHVSI